MFVYLANGHKLSVSETPFNFYLLDILSIYFVLLFYPLDIFNYFLVLLIFIIFDAHTFRNIFVWYMYSMTNMFCIYYVPANIGTSGPKKEKNS